MSEIKASLDDATFRSLFEAAPDGILLVDRAGTIVQANSACAQLFGYELGELVGNPVEIIVPESVRAKHGGLRDRYFAAPHRRPMGSGLELQAARKGGTTIPVEISLSPVRFEGREGAIAVIRDVTEQRRLSRDLKRSNEELEQFAYVASHDLQEPLRMVSGYTQLLKRRYADKLDAEANEYIDFAVDGVKRMQALISDLLAFSRVGSRAKPHVDVELDDVMRQALTNLKVAIDESSAKVTFAPLPTVPGDRSQLTQLVQNLVGNALKFRKPGDAPEVSVSVVREGSLWRLSVADNGIGIDPAYRQKVFVIFQRLHAREDYPGTGMGLAIAKKIVENHGGRIWIDDTVTRGTTFHFTLRA
jgi:PAS domain S-box-containing protein